MAIGIRNYPQVTPPDSDYPDGRIKDDTGINDGTPINVKTNGDIQQFFAKLMRLAGITPNGLPDSEYNGLQLIQALKAFVSNRNWQTVAALNPTPFQNGWSSITTGAIDPYPVQFCVGQNGQVFLRGGATGGTLNSVIFTLPLVLRPNKDVFIPRQAFESSAWVSGGILITKTGTVSFSGSAKDSVYFDGISFFLD